MMSLLFPRKCILCRRLLRREELDLCGDCRRNTDPYASGERKFKFLCAIINIFCTLADNKRFVTKRSCNLNALFTSDDFNSIFIRDTISFILLHVL